MGLTPYYQEEALVLYAGDNIGVLPGLPVVDAVVTDPPYGWGYMGKKWDAAVPSVATWVAVMDRMKPGAHALVACGTRTQHRMATNLEAAGFEIRDIVAWVYSSGFAKSMDISKAIDREAGAEREVIGQRKGPGNIPNDAVGKWGFKSGDVDVTAPATPEAQEWDGWGTSLKPAMELWTLCRKPLEGTTVANVLAHGVGGLNVGACRIGSEPLVVHGGGGGPGTGWGKKEAIDEPRVGRFPPNVIHDGSDDVLALFPQEAGHNGTPVRQDQGPADAPYWERDWGSAARFYYCAKPDRDERERYLEDMPVVQLEQGRAQMLDGSFNREHTARRNTHPTVKPVALMRYLARLITPRGGLVLDPYSGSGSTLLACRMEGFRSIGIEVDKHYCEITRKRLTQQVMRLI